MAELDAALGRLAEAIRYKVEQDLDTIGYAFWAVHDIDRARRPADIAGAPLAALQAWLSWMRTIDSFEKVFDAGGWSALGDELLNDATSGTAWLSTAVKLMHFRSLRKAGEDMARGLYGPSYAESIRGMYDEAGRQHSEDAFAAVVKDYLRGQRETRLLAVIPPENARERGATGIISGSNAVVASIEEAINRSRGRLLDVSPGERAAEFVLAAANFDDLTQLIKRSVFQNLPIRQAEDDRSGPWLGSIHGLRQLQVELLNRYAASLRRQQVEVAFSAATSAASGLIEMSLKLGAAEPHAVITVIDLTELGAGAANWSHEVDVRELLSEVPQSMVWALATELEVLWHMAERVLVGIDVGIAEVAAAEALDEPGVAKAELGELDRLTNADCQRAFIKVFPGQMACGLGLSHESRLIIGGQPVTDVVQPWGSPAEHMTIYPLPTSQRHAVVVFGGVLPYVVDVEGRRATEVFVAKYGPDQWISWGADDRYVALLGSNEGMTWLHVISLGEHTKHLMPSYESRLALVFDEESFSWLTSNSFRVRLAECKGEYCGETTIPGDGTTAQFHVSEDGIGVVAIDDLSKVPVDLARMIAPAPDSTPPADAAPADVAIPEDRIELDDGTVIVGAAGAVSLPFASAFGTLEIAIGEIAGFAEETLTLADGSVLKGRFGDGVLPIETARGRLELPAARVVAFSRVGAETPTADPSPRLQLPPGRGLLTGQVTDFPFGQPVPGAKLRIVGSTLETSTDAQGAFELPYVPGSFRVTVSRDGYKTDEFSFTLQAATLFPVADIIIFRPPVGDGLFFRGESGWIKVNSCQIGNRNRNSAWPVTGRSTRLPNILSKEFVLLIDGNYVNTGKIIGGGGILGYTSPRLHIVLEGNVISNHPWSDGSEPWVMAEQGIYAIGQIPMFRAEFAYPATRPWYEYALGHHSHCFLFTFG